MLSSIVRSSLFLSHIFPLFLHPFRTACPGLACLFITMKRLGRQARISLMLSINATFFVAEIAVGYYASSLALVCDDDPTSHEKVVALTNSLLTTIGR